LQRTHRQSLRSFLFAAELDIVGRRKRITVVPVPEAERQRLITQLEQYAWRKFPPQSRSQVRLEIKARGNDVTVVERRPYYLDHTTETEHPIARFHYEPDGRWRLFWLRHTGRWYKYENARPTKATARLVRELETDPTHIFWG